MHPLSTTLASTALILLLATPAAAQDAPREGDRAPEVEPPAEAPDDGSDDAPDDAEDEPPEVDPSWALIAYRPNVRSGRVVMHVDAREGQVDALRFQAQGRRVVIDRVRFEFHDREEPVELRPRQTLEDGENGAPLELPEAGAIRRVRVTVRVPGGRPADTLNLLARRAAPADAP